MSGTKGSSTRKPPLVPPSAVTGEGKSSGSPQSPTRTPKRRGSRERIGYSVDVDHDDDDFDFNHASPDRNTSLFRSLRTLSPLRGGSRRNKRGSGSNTGSTSESSPSSSPGGRSGTSAGRGNSRQHERTPTEDSMAVLADDAAELDAGPRLFAQHRRTVTPMKNAPRNVEEASMDVLPSFGSADSDKNVQGATKLNSSSNSSSSNRIDKSPMRIGGGSGGGKGAKKKKGSKEIRSTHAAKFDVKAIKGPPPLPRLGTDVHGSSRTTRGISDVSTEALNGSLSIDTGGIHSDTPPAASAAGPKSPLSFFGGVLSSPASAAASSDRGKEESSIFRAAASRSKSGKAKRRASSDNKGPDVGFWAEYESIMGGNGAVPQAGSFDTLLSRDRSYHHNRASSSSRGSSRRSKRMQRSLLDYEDHVDNASISNLTQRSVATTGSIETVRHSNAVGKKRGDTSSRRLAIGSSRSIAGRIKPIAEDEDVAAAGSGGDATPSSSSSGSGTLPKVLRKTGTKIKRALRDVTGRGGDGRDGKPGVRKGLSERFGLAGTAARTKSPVRRGRLGSEPDFRSQETPRHASARPRLSSADQMLSLRRVMPSAAHVPRAAENRDQCPLTREDIEDAALRSRLDGLDVINLGSARYNTIKGEKDMADDGDGESPAPSLRHTPALMIHDMLRASGGKSPPEIILEGYDPGGQDRWTVRIEDVETGQRPNSNDKAQNAEEDPATTECQEFLPCFISSDPPQLQHTDDESEVRLDPPEEHHPFGSRVLLEMEMWGKDSSPPPEILSRIKQAEREQKQIEEDKGSDILSISAASCPVDIDEDIFIIESPEHLRSIHEAAESAIRQGSLDKALHVFDKIVRSLNSCEEGGVNADLLLAATHHNMAILALWLDNLGGARRHINESIRIRNECLPNNHPGLAVSFAKHGVISFALEDLEAAKFAFRRAISIRQAYLPHDHLEMGKLYNNLGCCHYQGANFPEALKAFTAGLDIQRTWMEGRVRREGIVFDTSVTLSNMGKCYLKLNDCDMTFYMYEEALLLQTSTFKKDHDSVIETLESIAFAKIKTGEVAEALRILKGIHRAQVAKNGPRSKEAIEVEGLMGSIYVQRRSYGDALQCFKSVLEWQENQLPGNHPSVLNARLTVEKIGGMLERSTV
mmetsp:Transcript_16142/g.35079  ORF Transcript_16142/g.35079 Transcript_16142/m.35079 type:complete len:1151 (-) Transcript_16142:88-3540(-)